MRDWLERHFVAVMVAPLLAGTALSLVVIQAALLSGMSFIAILAMVTFVVIAVGDVAITIVPDEMRSNATERTLRLVTNALRHVSGGLTQENGRAICELLLPETKATSIAIINTQFVVACAGDLEGLLVAGKSAGTDATREVVREGKTGIFEGIVPEGGESGEHLVPAGGIPAGIVVPVVVRDRVIGTIEFYYRRRGGIDRQQLAIANGLGELLSMQFSADELDRQAELTARAEVKALQAQINPHFLFNTLNTIAAFTRTDPMQARELLRDFASFYRQTLENSESLIPLRRELEQTRRYLRFERARFGEDRIVEAEHVQEGCEGVPVPAFLVQPIVENAVRHAMRDEGPLHIDIHVATEAEDVLIAVIDDGLGMDEETARRLIESASASDRESAKGTGIALRNVAERVERFYGIGSGLEVMSKPGEGTSVTIRLANAAHAGE